MNSVTPTTPERRPNGAVMPWFACLLLASVLAGGGCGLLRETTSVPQRTVQAVSGKSSSDQPDPAVVQADLMRFADFAITQISRTVEGYIQTATNRDDMILGMRARLANARNLVGLVTDPNPNVALVDTLSMASLTSLGLERQVTISSSPQRLIPVLESARIIESNAWKMAQSILNTDQQRELHQAIESYHNAHPDRAGTIFSRPQEFANDIRAALNKNSRKDGGFFSMLTIDPMTGLDPAVREITQTRLFAERALFAAQHAPQILRWEVELLTLQLGDQPAMQTLVSNSTSLTESVDRTSRTVEELPDRISAEREAILNALKDQEGQLIKLTEQVEATLNAGDDMSTSLNTTLITFDALMKRFGVGEPVTNAAPPDPDAKPFDILDYAKTADEVAAMAEQIGKVLNDLNTTLDSPALDAQIAKLNDVSTQAAAQARGLMNHAFLLGAGLIVIACAGALLVRKLGQKR